MLEKYRSDQPKASKVHLSALVVIFGSIINDKPKWYFRCHWYFRGIDCDYPVGVDSNYLMIYDFFGTTDHFCEPTAQRTSQTKSRFCRTDFFRNIFDGE